MRENAPILFLFMSNKLIRIVALFLVPCLIGDPSERRSGSFPGFTLFVVPH